MNRNNMKILKPILVMLSVCGLSLEYHRPKLQFILYIIWNSFMIASNIDFTLYIFDNIQDISIIFQDVLYFIGALLIQAKGFIYLKNTRSYLSIYETLCNVVDLRHSCGIKSYENVEKNCRIYFGCYSIAVFFAVFFKTIQPLATVLYKYLTGTLNISDWLQPFPTYLMSSKASPVYETIYIFNSITYHGYVFYTLSVDAIFFGIGMYIINGFEDVQNMILDLNEIINNKHSCNDDLSSIIVPKIIKCIKFHNVMLQCQISLQKTTVESIFLTIPSLLLVICCIILKITKGDELFGNATFFAIAVNCMILVYCYIGQLITSEGTNVAEATYNATWYACAPSDRKYFLQLIQCSQKYRYFHGYFFHCSLETFSNVLKASFSIAAVMHNLE